MMYQVRKSGEYIPVFKFMGEIYCPEVGKWGFVSHECSARSSELKKENPNLFDFITIKGKSGAKFFGYRLRPGAKPSDIVSPELFKFFEQLKRGAK